MFCKRCGNPNNGGNPFCAYCGAPLHHVQQSQQKQPATQQPRIPNQQSTPQPGAGKKRGIGLVLLLCLLGLIVIVAVVLAALGVFSPTVEREQEAAAATVPQSRHGTTAAPATEAPETNAPSTAAPTTPVETPASVESSEAPTEQTADPTGESTTRDILASFDKQDRRRINIFLSNFSEQFFDGYPADDYHLVFFSYLFNKINKNDNITYDDGCYCISADIVDQTTIRFFGKTIAHKTLSHTNEWGGTGVFEYRNGTYYTPAADGETYNNFTVATTMHRISDGTYLVCFDVYALDLSISQMEYTGNVGEDYYLLDSAQASIRSDLTYCYSGCATVRDYKIDGYPTYQLISYECYD